MAPTRVYLAWNFHETSKRRLHPLMKFTSKIKGTKPCRRREENKKNPSSWCQERKLDRNGTRSSTGGSSGFPFFSCSFVSSKAVAVTCCQIDSIIISPKCYIPCHLNISPISLLFYSNVSKWLKIGLMTLFDCWSNWFRRKICQNPIWSYNVNLKLGDSDWMDVDFVRTFYELCSYQIHRII